MANENEHTMKRCPFTLIEMLVVLVITGVLLGLTIPAFERLTVGTGVDAAARMVGGQLRLTRQYAISTRTRVALLIPQLDETIANGAPRHYTQFRACQVDSSKAWVAWIPNTKWEILPTGALLACVGTPGSSAAINPPSDPPTDASSSPIYVTGVPNFSSSVRAVLFKPNGKLDESAGRYVWLAEGFPTGTNTAKVRNTKNVIALYVDEYTGRISYPDLDPATRLPL